MIDLAAHYRALAQTADPLLRRVAARQQQRLRPRRASPAARPPRFGHVPLAALLAEAGNAVTNRRNGTLVSGHEPAHGSRSGNCLVVWPEEGRWWCSSCRAGGDAAALLMGLRGLSYRQAAALLAHRYGVGR